MFTSLAAQYHKLMAAYAASAGGEPPASWLAKALYGADTAENRRKVHILRRDRKQAAERVLVFQLTGASITQPQAKSKKYREAFQAFRKVVEELEAERPKRRGKEDE